MSIAVGTRVVVTFHDDGSTNTGVVTHSALTDKTMLKGSLVIFFDDQGADDEAYEYELQPDGTYFEVNNFGDPITITPITPEVV